MDANVTGLPNSSDDRFGFNAGPVLAVEMLASMVCLVLTCIVYLRLPELKNVPGKIVVSMCSTLFLTFLFLILDVFVRKSGFSVTCKVIGFLVHLSFLALFMWTNVMSFDIWKTMKSTKSGLDGKAKQRKTFIKYSAYAWTTSGLLTIVAFTIDFLDNVPPLYKPKFAQKRCWLSGTPAFLIYFNLPVGLTLVANLYFFIHTLVVLRRIKKQTRLVHATNAENRFRLNVKLLVVMGLVWITEYIPWITGVYQLYLISGMLTCLYGVFLFILFVCKKRIWIQIKERNLFCSCCRPCNCKNGSKNMGDSKTTSQTTQSSWFVKSSMESISVSDM